MASKGKADAVREAEIVEEEIRRDAPEWAVTQAEASEVEVWRPPAASQWRRKLSAEESYAWVAEHTSDLDMTDQASILEVFERFTDLDTVDDILSGGGTTKGRELPEVILQVDRIRFTEGDFTEGCPFYVILAGRRTDTQERVTITVGGWVLVAQAAQLHYRATVFPEGSHYLVPEGVEGALAPETYPFYFKIKQSDETARGYRVNLLASPMSR